MNADYKRIDELIGTVEEIAKRLGFGVLKTAVEDPVYNDSTAVDIRLTIRQKTDPKASAQNAA